MKCPNCSHENEYGANYCNKCGTALSDKKDWPSILLLAWSGSLIFFAAAYFAIGYLGTYFSMEWQVRNYAIYILSTIQAFTFLVIPFAIRKTSFKIISLVLVIAYIIWTAFTNINSIIYTYEISYT